MHGRVGVILSERSEPKNPFRLLQNVYISVYLFSCYLLVNMV